jgi:hypothetical protein
MNMLFLLVFVGAVGILGSPSVDAWLVSEIQRHAVVALRGYVTFTFVAEGILTYGLMASHP